MSACGARTALPTDILGIEVRLRFPKMRRTRQPGMTGDKSPTRHAFILVYHALSLGTEGSECNQIVLCRVDL